MTTDASAGTPPSPSQASLRHYLKLARPKQWSKGAFVVVGPMYALADPAGRHDFSWFAVAAALVSMSLASSACYVVNDIRDREADRHHPRKKRRPIASGVIPVRSAWIYAIVLYGLAFLALLPIYWAAGGLALALTAVTVALYVANVVGYSFGIKHVVILDVISLSIGFVLRVLAGCAAAGIHPSTWLLNCTFFLSMFLAFGKRLGERRTMGDEAGLARAVQGTYTEDLLRMVVVMSAVATLVLYAGYVQDRGGTWSPEWAGGFNVLWLTILPATFALLRCIVLVERGEYDDPTELAVRDRPFQVAAVSFGVITLAVLLSGPA